MKKFLKRFQAKGFVSGFLVATMLSATIVWANTSGVFREVFYGVRISINGHAWNPPSDMTPFITDGRTFLPVRGISEALGIPVTWDGTTSTVHLGTQPVGSPFFSTMQHFRSGGSSTVGNATSLGNTHANALQRSAGVSAVWREYNLNGQWTELTGDVLRLDRATAGAGTITFTGDGRELLVVTTTNNQQPQNISVDLRGVLILRIEINNHNSALANAMIQ
ncbi:MAG: stalk domain-containing protein [Defluviitaleaceae bacterium]|nr:stalk domain-containing protein [Defluviitaleaceae bacterium]